MSKEIMLFVGPSGAGKDTVADRMALLTGAEVTSLSSQVRIEAQKAGLTNPSREDLQLFANQMRQEHGNDIFAKLAATTVSNNGAEISIVNGVRHPDEIKVFDNPTVVGVNASVEVRFHRVIQRGRRSDPKTWDEFLACDKRENGTLDGVDGQQNYQCLAKANFIVENESYTPEELEYFVDLLVNKLIRGENLREVDRLPQIQPVDGAKTIVITNGPHGAGKTTIGREISRQMNIPHLYEIGGQLRQEVTYNALESSDSFDREVMRRELLRDHEILRDTSASSFILETWHTGNIAYALQRSPELAQEYTLELQKQLDRFSVFHLLILIDDSKFLERVTEKVGKDEMGKLWDFYKEVTGNTESLYRTLSLNHERIENNIEINVALQKAQKAIVDQLR